MSLEFMENPVTLVVKAPNQRIADQTVNCMLGWTVKKLKQHLENVYPSKPSEDDQKLIYSGRLLPDHLTLKEILRQFDEESHHTMHLVCSSIEAQSHNQMPNPTTSDSTSSQPSENELRYRGHSSSYTSLPNSTTQSPPLTMMPPGVFNPMAAMPQMPTSSTSSQGYTPEQYMWMQQQMYMQYYAQYMQYYQTGVPLPTSTSSPLPENVAPVNNVPVQVQAAPNDQPVRMNAQGGAMVDDDDEMGHWDWLDWIYALCRFTVLLGIVYSYSTLNRFAIVTGAFVFVYLLQAGWFRNWGNRRNAEGNQRPEQPQEQVPAQQNERNEEENRQEPQVHEETETPENKPEENSQPPTPEELPPPQPGMLSVTWCFISTFFTSLIPQPPADVNAN